MTTPAQAEMLHLARSFPAKPVCFVRGAGHQLFTAEGTAYTDLGGASHGVANFGHSHPRIVAAIQEQAAQLIHTTQTVPSPVRTAPGPLLEDADMTCSSRLRRWGGGG